MSRATRAAADRHLDRLSLPGNPVDSRRPGWRRPIVGWCVRGCAPTLLFDAGRIVERAEYTDSHPYADGVVHLFINGEPVIEDGELTALPGRFLERRREPSAADDVES